MVATTETEPTINPYLTAIILFKLDLPRMKRLQLKQKTALKLKSFLSLLATINSVIHFPS